MENSMIVDITQEAIDRAAKARKVKPKPFWPECCPVAQAIRQQIPKAKVTVGLAVVAIQYPDGDTHHYHLPPEGMEFVRKADFHEELAPTQFQLIRG
jgi:hypothetical protein